MRQRAWIGGGVVLGAALLCLLIWQVRSNSASQNFKSFQPQPLVEINGKGFGAGDLVWLASGEAPWPFATPGFSERTITFPAAVDLRPFSTLHIPLHLTGTSIGRIRAKLRFVHHNGWVYETWQELPLYFGERGTLDVDIGPDSCDMVPVGHGRPWDAESARAIKKLTLSVHSEGITRGYLNVGEPKLDAIAKPGKDRETNPFSVVAGAVWPPLDVKVMDFATEAKGDVINAQFRLEPAPPDPFDPEHCDLRVLLVRAADEAGLSGKLTRGAALDPAVLAQARVAYFDQNYFLYEGVRNPAEELKPLGAPFFRARIPLDPASAVAGETPATAVLVLNGKVFTKSHIILKLDGPDHPNLTLPAEVASPPQWSFSGGEVFCEVYRPRTEWTGMPWRTEAAKYVGIQPGTQPSSGSIPKHAAWSFGPALLDRSTAWVAPIEWNQSWGKWQGLGRYDLELCWRFERILERAQSEGVRLPLLLTSDNMFFNQGKYRWPMNPLNAESGGPVAGAGKFFSDAQARANFRRRLRYLAARYGTSPALESWLFGATLPADHVPAWHQEMAGLLHAIDNARGWYHAPAGGLSEGVPEGRAGAATTAALAHEIVSLHPWATEFAQVSRTNSFEPGTEDALHWKAEQRLSPGTEMRISSTLASDGRQSVALHGKVMPGNVCLIRELLFPKAEADNFYDFHSLLFDVYVPPGAPHDMRAVVHLRDRDELWYEALLDPLLRPGEWTTCVLDITADNIHKLKPVNHQRPWDDYSRTRIREIGFRIFCGHKFDGEIDIDNIHFAGEQVGRITPKVTPVVQVRGTAPVEIARFDKWEIDFDLNKSYPNPYDPEVIDVSARITRPDGKEVVVPAFFYEPYERRLAKRNVIPGEMDEDVPHEAEIEEIVPVSGGMKGYWKLRYAPDLEGAHTVVIEVREGGKWQREKQVWVPDDRFTHEGKALPAERNYFENQFTEIADRQQDGRRLLQELSYQKGEVVARGEPLTFTAGKANVHGFVKRSKDPRYLEHSDGSFYYPIGMNLSTPSEEQLPFLGGRWRAPAAYRFLRDTGRRGTYQYDDYFAEFEKHHLNWGKLWMATWWTAMEWRRDWPPFQGAGRYSQPNAWRMDYLIEAARSKGVFLQIILMNHGQVSSGINHDWENNPANVELGGPVMTAREFYSDYNAKRLFKNKLRYIAARWGYSTSILDWTICGEMDFTEDYQTNSFDLMTPAKDKPAPESMTTWLQEMGEYMKDVDPGHHLIGTHVSHPQRGQNIQQVPVLDYVQSNAYSGFPWLANGSMNAVKALTSYYFGQGGQNHFKGMHAFGKPVLICEQGGHWHGISKKYGNWTRNTRESLDADLHCGLWAGALTPLAGQTGYWWWLHVHFDGGYTEFEALHNFMQGEDLRGQNFERNTPYTEADGKPLESLAFQNAKHGFAWFYDRTLPFQPVDTPYTGVKATLNDVEEGTFEIEYWDTHKGTILDRQTVASEANPTHDGYHLKISLPVFKGDVAVKFTKKK
jgi:hypothetical protein